MFIYCFKIGNLHYEMEKRWCKWALNIVLVLIAIQLIFAGIQQMYLFSLVDGNYIITLSVILIGILFVLSTIFIFLEKKWIIIPLIILLSIFLLYIIYSLISTIFYLIKDVNVSLMNWQLFIMIEYIILSIIAIILTLKFKKSK